MTHHPPDRHKRQQRAQTILAQTQGMLTAGLIHPAQVVPAFTQLGGRGLNGPVTLHDDMSQQVAMALGERVGVLIFGSATKPGGGWLNGAKAQEEELSLASTWGEQARLGGEGFYSEGKGLGGLGPDKIVSAQSFWLMDPHGRPLATPTPVHLVSVVAPNLRSYEVQKIKQNDRITHLAKRLATALETWRDGGCDKVVLGAIGCGVFQWPGQESARALALAIKHQNLGGMAIHLALPDPQLRQIFEDVLVQEHIPTANALTRKRPTP